MKKQLQNEQGLTLVEVIISLTILMVIALSVSGIITTVINNRQFAQQKQKASMIGQDIMEEILLVEKLSKSPLGYYIPLTIGSDLVNTSDPTSEIGRYVTTLNSYQIALDLKKTEISDTTSFSVQDEVSVQENAPVLTKLTIEISGENGNYKLKNVTNHSNEHDAQDEECPIINMVGHHLEIKYDSLLKKIQIGTNGHYFMSEILNDEASLDVSLRFLQTFKPNELFNIKIENSDSSRVMEVHLFKHIEVKANIDFPNPSGRIKILNNRLEGITQIGELYDFILSIEQNNKLLFETYGTKNFIKD